jgi:group I intron endonuclease
MFTIYKLTNKINLKEYIGFTCNFQQRIKQHSGAYGNGCKALYPAIRKYGWDNFSVEVLMESEIDIIEHEDLMIQKYNSKIPNGYNIAPGGRAGLGKMPKTEEHKRKIGDAHRGKKVKPESIAKLVAKLKGRKIPRERVERITKIQRQKFIERGSIGNRRGIPHTDEAKKKISEGQIGRAPTVETRAVLKQKFAERPKLTCPHCGKIGQNTVMQRHHMDRCKHKITTASSLPI